MSFKIGDRVRCIENSDVGEEFGTVGRLATVIRDHTPGETLGIRFDGEAKDWFVTSSRFELVTPKAPRVIRKTLLIEAQPEGGFLVSEPDIYIHNEAKRLAAFSRLSEAVGFIEEAMA